MEIFLKFVGLFIFISLLLIPKRLKTKKKIPNKEIAADHSEYGITEDGNIARMNSEREYED